MIGCPQDGETRHQVIFRVGLTFNSLSSRIPDGVVARQTDDMPG